MSLTGLKVLPGSASAVIVMFWVLFADGAKDNGLQMLVRVSWIGHEDTTNSQNFVFTDKLISGSYTRGTTLKVTLSGMNELTNVIIEVVLLSDIGVESAKQVYVFNPTTANEG